MAIRFSAGATAQNLETDRLALVKLYQATNGQFWGVKTGWVVPGISGDNPCGWYGITCSGGRVTEVNLGYNQLNGQIPVEIGNLNALTHLDLQGDGAEFAPLRGNIPAEMGNLTNLEFLNLRGNVFDGDNLSVIGGLTKLKHFEITASQPIPEEFGNLINLEYLWLGTGEAFSPAPFADFPTFIFGFNKLKELYMPGSFLKGSIPAAIGNLVNLEVLDVQSNDITGTIPPEIGNLTKLKKLLIFGNGLSGGIPSELGNLANLEVMELKNTNLNGPIPASFTNLSKLTLLTLSSTSLSGPIPDLSGIPAVANVSIQNSRFTFAGMESNITVLDTYGNQAQIPIQGNFQSNPSGSGVMLSVDAGGTLTNNTYKWYKNGSLVQTNVGNAEYFANSEGVYKVAVTNSIATQLTLTSQNYNIVRLPVKLMSFTGVLQPEGITLTWKTSSETDNLGFVVERSEDARTFVKVGFVDGNGRSTATNIYNFLDVNYLRGGYYRLKQIDFDGKFEYSKIISVKMDQAEISLFPNPATNQFFVKGLEKEETVVIKNSRGYVLSNQKIGLAEPVVTSKLANGIYLIQIGEEVKKIVIQK